MATNTTKSPKKAVKQVEKQAGIKTEIQPTVAAEELHYLISQRAYERFLQRGFGSGNDLEDWLLAEQDILGALCTPAPAPVVVKPKRATRTKTVVASPAKSQSAAPRPRRKSLPKED